MTLPAGRASYTTALVGLAFLAASCSDPEPDAGSQKTPDAAAVERVAVPGEDLSKLDELAAIGYVDRAEPDGEARTGVVLNETGRAWPGYNLVTSLSDNRASLVDMDGRVLHTWKDPEATDARWVRTRLLKNGDLLGISSKEDAILRLGFDGRPIWRLHVDAHHDGIELPDGRLLVLVRRLRTMPDIDPVRRCVDNMLVYVSAGGELLEKHSLYEILGETPEILRVVAPPGTQKLPAEYNLDPIHANTIHLLENAALAAKSPIFRQGNLLITLRHLDSLIVIDPRTWRCLWAWGKGMLQGPHDACAIADGNLLLLDNGYPSQRDHSRLVEVDPVAGRIVWEYVAKNPSDFFTTGRGTVQELPNHDVLVGNSNNGEAFEITRDGEIVWRYLDPVVDAEGARGVIRIQRYDPAFVDPFLVGASPGR